MPRDEPRELWVGASLSLSGGLRLQGEQALDGLRLWMASVASEGGVLLGATGRREPIRLRVLDDRSRASVARENVRRLLDDERVDVLVGPYSSGLTQAEVPLAAARGKTLWNHGGSSDAIVQQGWPRVVSVPSPASDYFGTLPGWVRRQRPSSTRLSILHAQASGFARQVARGAAEGATVAGFHEIGTTAFESPLADAPQVLVKVAESGPDLLVVAGSFQDDVALVRHRRLLPSGTTLAVVAAGLSAFQAEVGDLAEGVIGPSQWEPDASDPPTIGPDSAWFCQAFRRMFQETPEYPAAQAFALGIVLAECLRRAGHAEDGALFRAAQALDARTLYGGFQLDPATGRQVAHRIRLVQWQAGRKVVIG